MQKEYETYLVLDYKTGKFRVNAKQPKDVKANEIPIHVKLNVKLPEKPNIVAKGEITLSESKLQEMFIDQL